MMIHLLTRTRRSILIHGAGEVLEEFTQFSANELHLYYYIYPEIEEKILVDYVPSDVCGSNIV